MVKLLNHIGALMRLIRWPNLLIVAASQILIRQCIIIPLLARANMEAQLSNLLFSALVIATVLITAGGYAINDYFDRKIDRINKPDSQIVGTLIYPRHAMAYHLIFSVTGVMLGTFVAVRINQLYLSLLFFMGTGLLWFYSTIYKREFLFGNVVVALMTASVPFLILLFELPLLAYEYRSDASPISGLLMRWVLGFSLFAFLMNLVREIVKDIEDFEGDKIFGKKTIPVIWGIRTAQWISAILMSVTIALLSSAWFFFIRDTITLIYFLILLVIPMAIVAIMLLKAMDRYDFHKASTGLKIIMLTGMGYMIVANLLISHLR